jgi:hypothetical protein
MKFIIFCIFGLFSMASIAETTPKVDESVMALSKSMGINNIIDAVMTQTRESLKKSMIDLSANLRAQYPNLNKEQHTALNNIFNKYVDSIIDSVDINKASYIYAQVISEGMSKDEIKKATKYYTSTEGKNLLKVASSASTKLNNYMLEEITASAKTAQKQLIKDLTQFKSNLPEKASK